MPVTLMLYLFGKPGVELHEGATVTSKELRDLADDLHVRLRETADLVEKLTGAGWETEMLLYDVALSHPFLNSVTQAEEALLNLGIDPSKVHIDEWEEEQYLEEDEDGGAEDEDGGLRPGDRLA